MPLSSYLTSSTWVCPVMNVIEGELQSKHNLGEPAEKLLTAYNSVCTAFICREENKFVLFRQVFKKVIYKVTDLFCPIN